MTVVGLMTLVAASVTESGFSVNFNNTQDGTSMRLSMTETGHPKINATPIYVDNITVMGITNNTIKNQRLRAMNLQYFWIMDQANLQNLQGIVGARPPLVTGAVTRS